MPSVPRTLVAILTPPGRSAVAVLALWGPRAAAVIERHFLSASQRSLADAPLNQIRFGRWGDEELVAVRRGGERFEIHTHGGAAAPRAVVQSLLDDGCELVSGDAASLDLSLDSIAREALLALQQARTLRTAELLWSQKQGALRQAIEKIHALILAQHTDAARERLQRLVDRYSLGKHLTTPFRVVLAGSANVGKSSLINALLGYDRAIVFDEPGTTRDVVTANTAIDGWPVELSDTAGLRDTLNPLEAQGIARAYEQMRTADLLLLVNDATQPWSVELAELRQAWPDALWVHNKCDLIQGTPHERPAGVYSSAVLLLGIDTLLREVAGRLVPEPPQLDEPMPFCERHVTVLQTALDAVLQNDLRAATEALAAL